jgi:hypothetical protein
VNTSAGIIARYGYNDESPEAHARRLRSSFAKDVADAFDR